MMATAVTNINQSTKPEPVFIVSDNSRAVSSNQAGIHPKLATSVERHLATRFLRPPAAHSQQAFAALAGELAKRPRPLVLDSFCGTGMSTALLAARHPGHLVVGVDQSAHRLARHNRAAGNYLLLQADCEDIWQLLLSHGFTVDYHYLLYPNPWPKAKHLRRRIHGHASFPWLLQLGGAIELRSNWQLYVEEFGLAMHIVGRLGAVSQVSGDPAMTLFEEKYRRSNHTLWRYLSRPAP